MTADADLVSQMSGQNGQGGQTAPLPPTADAALTPAPPDKQLAQAANPTADADAAMPAFPVTKVTVAAPPPVTAPARQTVDCLPQQQAPLPAPPQAVATAAKPQQAATTGRQAEETPKGETVATVPAAAATATPVTGASAAGELDVAGDGETALTTADDTAPAPPRQAPAETATATGFAALVEQQANPADRVAADTAQTAQRPAGPDPNNVAGQIVDHARLITRAENNEMVIKLKPEHLGELTLKIAVENGTVRATFHTPNAEVRSAIEASLPQLRHDMANQGLKVDYVGVYASLDHFFANDQRHAPHAAQLTRVRRPSGEETYTERPAAIEMPAPNPRRLPRDRLSSLAQRVTKGASYDHPTTIGSTVGSTKKDNTTLGKDDFRICLSPNSVIRPDVAEEDKSSSRRWPSSPAWSSSSI
jgi:flagellar hook-length control protein FliK